MRSRPCSQPVPDLSPTLRTATPEELADLFDAFKVKVVYDKANRMLTLAATLAGELVPENEKTPTARGPVGEFVHSGGGMWTHFPDQSYRFVEVRDLPSRRAIDTGAGLREEAYLGP